MTENNKAVESSFSDGRSVHKPAPLPESCVTVWSFCPCLVPCFSVFAAGDRQSFASLNLHVSFRFPLICQQFLCDDAHHIKGTVNVFYEVILISWREFLRFVFKWISQLSSLHASGSNVGSWRSYLRVRGYTQSLWWTTFRKKGNTADRLLKQRILRSFQEDCV